MPCPSPCEVCTFHPLMVSLALSLALAGEMCAVVTWAPSQKSSTGHGEALPGLPALGHVTGVSRWSRSFGSGPE